MTCQPEHLEQLNCLTIDVGKDHAGAALFCYVDYSQEYRNPNAVDQLGAAKIYHQRLATRLQLSFALALDAFATDFVEIVASVDYRRRPHTARPY